MSSNRCSSFISGNWRCVYDFACCSCMVIEKMLKLEYKVVQIWQ